MKYIEYFEKVKAAARTMSSIDSAKSTAILKSLSKALLEETDNILEANKLDLARMEESNPRYDRLKLTAQRLEDISADLINVAELPSPIGDILEEKTLPNGLKVQKKRVALGTIGIIYEARPNVTIDVFALCLRSGNACVLKGGSDAADSNKTLTALVKRVLNEHGIDQDIIQLLPPPREAATELMNAQGYVDVLIPRGSQGLINSVRENSKIPVIETGAGIVHTYFDKSGDIEKAVKIIDNAKTRRVSVCNALDCLIIHKDRLKDLPAILAPMADKKVEVVADKDALEAVKDSYPSELLSEATEEDFGTEFLAMKMAVKTVDSYDAALDHIYTLSSKHSEAIIAEDPDVIERFMNVVDAAAVYVNTSTAFTDGSQFGLGAEIGISTQKLHARGPMALNELTSYKWIVTGQGHIRS